MDKYSLLTELGMRLATACNTLISNETEVAKLLASAGYHGASDSGEIVNGILPSYSFCRTRPSRQAHSPTDDPKSTHSKATYLAVHGFADIVHVTTGINPLLHDGSEGLHANVQLKQLISYAKVLAELHQIQMLNEINFVPLSSEELAEMAREDAMRKRERTRVHEGTAP